MASDKLAWIDFYAFSPGDVKWTLACDLVSGRVCLTSFDERGLREMNRRLSFVRTELDTYQALLLARQRIIDNAQFHVAHLDEATLRLIESEYPFHRFQRLLKRVCAPGYYAIDDSGKSFSCGTGEDSMSCITWGVGIASPVKELFALIKKASGLSRHTKWWR
ncbi:hypothetical protein [Enorma phocaeensis]|uniref:hypothetical protein n=1 Tax=Enorma phocaeensis TaxID=1871019 RepID=UPI000C84653E|nr:hypothetical protein [Enorma phocaeensis]